MLRPFDPETGRDRVFVPVSINYDWTLEDLSLVYGEDPRDLPPVRLFAATLLSVVRNIGLALTVPRRLGTATVHFGTPISARTYARTHGASFDLPNREERGKEIRAFAQHLMDEISAGIPLAPTSAVSYVLRESPEARLLEEQLYTRVEALTADARGRGVPITPDFSSEDGLDLLVLRGLVEKERALYRKVAESEKLLAYYAASVSKSPKPT
jgi:glycerol-3-phosphate O-acyltransferase